MLSGFSFMLTNADLQTLRVKQLVHRARSLVSSIVYVGDY